MKLKNNGYEYSINKLHHLNDMHDSNSSHKDYIDLLDSFASFVDNLDKNDENKVFLEYVLEETLNKTVFLLELQYDYDTVCTQLEIAQSK